MSGMWAAALGGRTAAPRLAERAHTSQNTRTHGRTCATPSSQVPRDDLQAGLAAGPMFSMLPLCPTCHFQVPCDDLEAGLVPAADAELQTLPHVPMALHASW